MAITGRRAAALEAAAREAGGETLAFPCDVASLEQIDALTHRLAGEMPGLDILFANAGLFTNAPLGSISETDFDAIFDINVKGVFFTVQTMLPLLRPGASVILNASIAWRMGRPESRCMPPAKPPCALSPGIFPPISRPAASG